MRIKLAALAAVGLTVFAVGTGAAIKLALKAGAVKQPAVKVVWGDSGTGKPRAYRYGELSVTLSAHKGKYGMAPQIAVATPRQGKASLIGQEAANEGASATFFVMKLDPKSDGPAVIFTSFSWGAHCCTEIDILDPIGAGWALVKTGSWDGDGLTETPRDINGDGVPDIVLRDNAFLYTFDAYAFSWAPPLVLNVVGGKLSDVSASGRYRSLFADDMAGAKVQCLKHSNGACAGYVADAARIGQADAAWRVMLGAYQHNPEEMWRPKVCAAATAGGACPKGKEQQFKDFPPALAWFLANGGYITAAKAEALAKAR